MINKNLKKNYNYFIYIFKIISTHWFIYLCSLLLIIMNVNWSHIFSLRNFDTSSQSGNSWLYKINFTPAIKHEHTVIHLVCWRSHEDKRSPCAIYILTDMYSPVRMFLDPMGSDPPVLRLDPRGNGPFAKINQNQVSVSRLLGFPSHKPLTYDPV